MRPIKFRAWDKENEVMVYPKGILFDGRVVNFSCGILEPFEGCELMQYTGLKDKNGTEIYEGDIVDVVNGITVVTYDDGCFRAKLNGSNYRLSGWKSVEVIGNIYENPELLDGEKHD